jgi:WD40 repeat protein
MNVGFTRRYRKPLVLLSLALLLVAVAGASWAAWITSRNRERDELSRKRYEKIAASRGITIVDEPLLVLRGHTRAVNQVAFSPDGTRIASAGGDGDATVKLWDSQTGELVRTLSGHKWGVYNLAFSRDGDRLASAGHDHTAVVWDVRTGDALRTFGGLEIHVGGVAFSPDGKRLATADGDAVRVWEVETGGEALTLQRPHDGAHCVAFSPDGKRLATAGGDNTVKVWKMPD